MTAAVAPAAVPAPGGGAGRAPCLLGLIMAVVVKVFLVELRFIPGPGMGPTLMAEDWVSRQARCTCWRQPDDWADSRVLGAIDEDSIRGTVFMKWSSDGGSRASER